MGQGALSKPIVQWWLSLNSSTGRHCTSGHPRTSHGCVAVTLLHVALNCTKTKRGFLTTTRSQPRLGLVARCGDLAL